MNLPGIRRICHEWHKTERKSKSGFRLLRMLMINLLGVSGSVSENLLAGLLPKIMTNLRLTT